MGEDTIAIVTAHCNGCRRKTDHFVRGTYSESRDYGDDERDLPGDGRYEILECCGCHDMVFRRTIWLEEDDYVSEGSGRLIRHPYIAYFPPVAVRHKPDWFGLLGSKMQTVLRETYIALNADLRALAAMGARSVLDLAMQDKVGDCGTFKDKLNEMLRQHLINSDEKDLLEAALDAGSAAAHRGHEPSAEELSSVMDIVEHILQAIYVLPEAAAKLREQTPQRQKPAR